MAEDFTVQCGAPYHSAFGDVFIDVTITSINGFKHSISVSYTSDDAADACTPPSENVSVPRNASIVRTVKVTDNAPPGGTFTATGAYQSLIRSCNVAYP